MTIIKCYTMSEPVSSWCVRRVWHQAESMSKALFPVTIWSLITLLGLAVSQYAMIYAGLLESYMLPGMRGPYSSTLLYAFLRAGCSGNASCSHAKILGESFMPQPIKHLECYKALGVTKHPLNASPCFHGESLFDPSA